MEPINALADQQDSLQKQKIEGFQEYANELNGLTAKQFASFLVTSTPVNQSLKDCKNFVKDGIKPASAVQDIIQFFTKEGDTILDVFSGSGENLKLISELGRIPFGIEKDPTKIAEYKADVASDVFLEEATLFQGDALSVAKDLDQDFDFILLDPPIKKAKTSKSSLEEFRVEEYVLYLSELIEVLSSHLKPGKFLVCLVQDFYNKGVYFPMPFAISNMVFNLFLKGIKIYSRQVDANSIPNRRVYAPVQNHFYALIFTS